MIFRRKKNQENINNFVFSLKTQETNAAHGWSTRIWTSKWEGSANGAATPTLHVVP